MEMYDTDLALIAALLQNISSEKALALYGLRPTRLPRKNLYLTKEQALNLIFLKETMTRRELAEPFGINAEALRMQVCNAIKKLPRSSAKLPQ